MDSIKRKCDNCNIDIVGINIKDFANNFVDHNFDKHPKEMEDFFIKLSKRNILFRGVRILNNETKKNILFKLVVTCEKKIKKRGMKL